MTKDQQANAVAEEIRILAAILTKESGREMERRLSETGLGISGLQHGVLQILSRQECTISELSKMMMLTPATLVPVVDALEEKQLVQRGRDANDRRRNPLTLTSSGRKILESVPLPAKNDLLVANLKEMGDKKTQQLLTLLRELVQRISADETVTDKVQAFIRSNK